MFNDLVYFVQRYLDAHTLIVPLGIIGLWRWSVWFVKEIGGNQYKPKKNNYKASVSIVTPVYNEDPVFFKKALQSWKKNKPAEIIAVIDYTDKKCIKIFKDFKKSFRRAHLLITKVPGKRPALALGIKKAKSELVALVDSDTLWDKDVLKNGLPPFKEKKMGAVATYQGLYQPTTLAQKLFDTQLDIRYFNEYSFLSAHSDALPCISGRTAFYRRKILLPMLKDLVNETFLGKKVISGDDKRLTYLVLRAGYKVYYQHNSKVYTPGMKDLSSFMKQRIRWSRNSIRAELKISREKWVQKHPVFLAFQIDKLVQAFTAVLSPIFFVVWMVTGLYVSAATIFVWWFVSRAIKMHDHLRRRPEDIKILPAFVANTFASSVIKLYALLTLNTQGWITRWDKSRLANLKLAQRFQGYALTVAVIAFLAFGVLYLKQEVYFKPRLAQSNLIANTIPFSPKAVSAQPAEATMSATFRPKDLVARKHVLQNGESLGAVAAKYGVTMDNMLLANVSFLTNWNRLEPGTLLNVPGKDHVLTGTPVFNYQRIYGDILSFIYDEPTDTFNIYGRGKTLTLSDIRAQIGEEHLQEVAPKVWLLKSTLYLRSGVTLILDKSEVTWLKLESNTRGHSVLRALNGNILVEGVKITSWDSDKNDYDKNLEDGRSFIMVKDSSRMDFKDSELAYLGYPRSLDLTVSPYGVSWKMSNQKLKTLLLTGEVINSKFHHNYFGAYTFGATGMIWKNNKFYDNKVYGLDPHDDSNGFLVENNEAYNNGTHGIIFSKRCVDNVIRNNVSHHNGVHGIMLHEMSDNNLVEGNVLYNNGTGIALWRSSNNVVRNNVIRDSERGIRANVTSNGNIFSKNTITNISQYGIYLYDNANGNQVTGNKLENVHTFIYVKTSGNTIRGNSMHVGQVGVYFFGGAANNVARDNSMSYNRSSAIYSEVKDGAKNTRGNNRMYRNRKDVLARELQDTSLAKK